MHVSKRISSNGGTIIFSYWNFIRAIRNSNPSALLFQVQLVVIAPSYAHPPITQDHIFLWSCPLLLPYTTESVASLFNKYPHTAIHSGCPITNAVISKLHPHSGLAFLLIYSSSLNLLIPPPLPPSGCDGSAQLRRTAICSGADVQELATTPLTDISLIGWWGRLLFALIPH